ncbi:MAG: helix-turn-helix domain-containing protein, partial [Planctomycetota bacterium]
ELLGALFDSKRTREDDAGSALVKKTQAYIRRHLNENLNVSDLAALMRVSREHLSRVFTLQTGTPLYRYVVRQKMLEAARLLKESDLSAKEVSRKLGYAEPAHFSRLFKSAFQLTPGQFRRHGSVPIQ